MRFFLRIGLLAGQGFLLRVALPAQAPPLPEATPSVIIQADSQEKDGDLYRLRGRVAITYDETRLFADQADYNAATEELVAEGNVYYTRSAQNEDIHASRVEYNLRKGTGSFFDVEGSVGGLIRAAPSLLTTTNPFYFRAEQVDRLDEETYRVRNGEVTVCSPDRPTWTFSVSQAIIRPGQAAHLYHSKFRLWQVPVLYFPFLYRSLRRIPRTSGFLMPNVGNSSRLGLVLGDSFFWAINRSVDLEVGGEYLSKRGWSQQAHLRTRPTHSSYLNATFYGVMDRGFGPRKVDQGGQTIRAEGVAQFPGGFRGVLDFNYLSSLLFRGSFAQTYTEAVDSESQSTGFVSRNFNSFGFNLSFSRVENFQSIRPNDTIIIRQLPRLEFNSVPRPLWRKAPVWVSWDSSAGLMSRSEPGPGREGRVKTSTLERLDFSPRLTLPLQWKGMGLTTAFGYRFTHYGGQRHDQQLSGKSLFRGTRELTLRLDLPALSKVFSGTGSPDQQPLQHVIEPKVTFRSVSGVEDFRRFLLFDEQDLVADTQELEFSLTQRLLAGRPGSLGPQEIFSWQLRQQYYFDPTFGGALMAERRNVFPSTLNLSPAAFLDVPRRFSPLVSIVRFRPSGHYDIEYRQDYDTVRLRFSHGGLVGNARWGDSFISASHFFVRSSENLAALSNQLRFVLGRGNLGKPGLNAAFAATYDVRGGFLQFSAVQVSYNNDCCGISFEFRRFALGPVRNENQFRLAFSLANIGTFGTLKK
ncbi:MAG: LPS-assembly protein LptD, partial [Acidobacteria bacterium]|nr:LPS-assembly protein LptD [Acidobacteriota bacterium]